MALITILLCLALQRFANIGGWFQSSWFTLYLKRLNPWITKFNEWITLLLIIAPILLLLTLLDFLFSWKLLGLLNLFLATLVLFFCIDARDCKNKLAGYFTNLKKGDVQATANAAIDFIGENASSTTTNLTRAVTKTILLNSFTQLFSGLFWFIVGGIYGVTVYFLITLLHKNALKIDSNYARLAKLAEQAQDILDWLPSRLIGISYALAGNFSKGFNYWYKNLWAHLSEVRKFAINSGIAALDADPDITKAVPNENYAALDLINHVLIIWLVVLALILIGIWL